jgi:hypothetical protein
MKNRILEPLRGFDTPLTIPLKTPPHSSADPAPGDSKLLKIALNALVADERTLDDPRDLTDETTAHTGFYVHRAQADRALLTDRAALPPDTPTP